DNLFGLLKVRCGSNLPVPARRREGPESALWRPWRRLTYRRGTDHAKGRVNLDRAGSMGRPGIIRCGGAGGGGPVAARSTEWHAPCSACYLDPPPIMLGPRVAPPPPDARSVCAPCPPRPPP